MGQKDKPSSSTIEPVADPAFEEALAEYTSLLVEEQSKEYLPGLEPFSVQANKIRDHIGNAMRTFHNCYAKGYALILKELKTLAPEIDLLSVEPSDEAREILDNPIALANYLSEGNALYKLLGFSKEILTKIYIAAYHLMENKKFTDAKNAFFFLTTIAPTLSPSWLALGYSYGRLCEYEKAIEACRQAITLNPEDPEAYLTLSHLYTQIKNFEEALQILDQGLLLATENRGKDWAETLGSLLEEAKIHLSLPQNPKK